MNLINYILIFLLFSTILAAQNGTAEAENGIIIGNNAGTQAGTVRWTGTDFEGYNGSNWISLTYSSLLSDNDGDTKIDLEGIGDEDQILIKASNANVLMIDKQHKLYIGRDAGSSNGNATASTGIGYMTMQDISNGFGNSAFGYQAMENIDSGSYNLALGTEAMRFFSNGDNNIGIGRISIGNMKDGERNVAIGDEAMSNADSAISNIALGKFSLRESSGMFNLAAGESSLRNLDSGSKNVALGYFAGRELDGDSQYNVLIGASAGRGGSLHEKDKNVMIGYRAGFNNLGNGSVLLGHQAGYFETKSNTLYIENTIADSSNALIYGEFDNNLLRFNADAHIVHDNDSSSAGLRIINNGNTDEYWRLFVNSSSGDLNFYSDENSSNARAWIDENTGAYASASDKRLKKNITVLPSTLERVLLLSPKSYWYNEQDQSEQKSIGFLAQEAKLKFPELVHYQQAADQYGINYAGFSVVAIKAIQEQQEIIERQQESLETQKQLVSALKNSMENLSRKMAEQDKKVKELLEKMKN